MSATPMTDAAEGCLHQLKDRDPVEYLLAHARDMEREAAAIRQSLATAETLIAESVQGAELVNAELKALREDKARLDWLEARKHVEIEVGTRVVCLTQGERCSIGGSPFHSASGRESPKWDSVGYPYRFEGDLRSAIDQQRTRLTR